MAAGQPRSQGRPSRKSESSDPYRLGINTLGSHRSNSLSANEPITIGHVLHRLVLAGAEVLAADLARKLRGSYRFVFLCLDEIGPLGERLQDEGFTVLDLGRRPGIDLSVARRIRQATVDHRIRLLHAHQYTPFFYAAVLRGIRRNPKVLFTEHGRHYPDIRSLKRVVANKLLIRRNDRVTAVGRFVKQALVDKEGISPSRIEVIYNGIDPTQQDLPSSTRSDVRQELQAGPDQPIVLQVARFHPVKDHETAIRAFALALKQLPQALLVLAGDGERRADIEALIRELGIADHVRLLGVRQDVPRLMAASDLFMLSSVSEGVSVTLLEAMAAGLPIAATQVGGNPEVVEDGETGLLAPRSDDQRMAENLVKILSNKTAAGAMGKKGREKLHKYFNQSTMHQSYAKIYDQILSVS